MGKVARFSVSTGQPSEVGQSEKVIVLVPPKFRLERGFARARALLNEGLRVRLIGENVTLVSTWPDWVEGADGLTLTELGAYRAESLVTGGAPVREAVERWLDATFAGELGELRGSDVFYGSAMVRLFERYHDEYPLLRALAEAHRGATFECSEPSWDGAARLHHLVLATGGRVDGHSVARTRGLGWKLVGLAAAGLCASAVRAAADARRSLAGLSSFDPGTFTASRPPRTWIAITPTWLRANRHVLASVGEPVLSSGEPLGVLLFGTLARGARSETATGALEGDALWPGLGALHERRTDCQIHQVSQPVSWWTLGHSTFRAARRSILAVSRVLRTGDSLRVGEYTIPLGIHVHELARLLTIDIVRQTIAEDATKRFLSTVNVEGASIFFAASQLADTVVIDQLLQRAKATTFEFHHGSIGDDWAGGFRPRSTVACVWTRSDARSIAELGQRALVAKPMPQERALRSSASLPRVLIMTNYTHWGLRVDKFYPQLPLLSEVFAGIDRIAATRDAEFRWRPHPADDPEVVEQTLLGRSHVARSISVDVATDIAWADIVVASLSTTVIEALLLGHAPVIVHVPPEMVDITPTQFIRPERSFFRAEELVDLLGRCLDADNADEGLLAPEDAAREDLFERDQRPLLQRANDLA